MALNVVVMGFLNCADFGFKTEDLGAVFAQHAGRRWGIREGRVFFAVFGQNRDGFARIHREDLGAIGAGAAVGRRVFARLFDNAFGEGLQDFRMVA